jgi:hypothetical protein
MRSDSDILEEHTKMRGINSQRIDQQVNREQEGS